MLRPTIWMLVVGLGLSWSAVRLAHAQPAPAEIEPYLDNNTLVVGWMDLSKLDLDQSEQFIQRLQGDASPAQSYGTSNAASARQRLRALHGGLVKSGVTRVYWIAENKTVRLGPQLFVIPTQNPDPVAQIAKAAFDSPAQRVEVTPTAVIAGDGNAIGEIQKREGNAPPALLQALESCKASHGLVCLTPVSITSVWLASPAARRLFEGKEDMYAKLAEALITSKSIAFETEMPATTARIRLRTSTDASAAMMKEVLNALVQANSQGNDKPLDFRASQDTVSIESNSVDQSVRTYTALLGLFAPRGHQDAMNNMKQIGLALHNYIDAHGSLPPQSLTDEKGTKLLSWRVLILPYLNQEALYNQFHLNEPWDSPHNLQLASIIPAPYNDVSSQTSPCKTRLVAPLSPSSAFGRPGKPSQLKDFKDGTSNTFWVTQADDKHAVVWSQAVDPIVSAPRDISQLLDPGLETPVLTGFADGSARLFTREEFTRHLWGLISIDGGEVIKF